MSTKFKQKMAYICLVDNLRIREHPYLSADIVGHYQTGQIIWGMDSARIHDGIIWGRYRADSRKFRFIALASADGSKRYMLPATVNEQKRERFVLNAIAIANDDKHGYSQISRWPVQGLDFDCSSLVYQCAHDAGYNVTADPYTLHYTGTMLVDFQNAEFTAYKFDRIGLNGLLRGDILLNVKDHTEICIGNNQFVGAHSSETGGITGMPGDQTKREINITPAYDFPWDYVLRPPA